MFFPLPITIESHYYQQLPINFKKNIQLWKEELNEIFFEAGSW